MIDPVGPHLAGRRRADGAEDAGADDRADGEHDQVAGAQHALERARGVGLVDDQVRNGLAAKEGHGGGFYRVRGRKASSINTSTSSNQCSRPSLVRKSLAPAARAVANWMASGTLNPERHQTGRPIGDLERERKPVKVRNVVSRP